MSHLGMNKTLNNRLKRWDRLNGTIGTWTPGPAFKLIMFWGSLSNNIIVLGPPANSSMVWFWSTIEENSADFKFLLLKPWFNAHHKHSVVSMRVLGWNSPRTGHLPLHRCRPEVSIQRFRSMEIVFHQGRQSQIWCNKKCTWRTYCVCISICKIVGPFLLLQPLVYALYATIYPTTQFWSVTHASMRPNFFLSKTFPYWHGLTLHPCNLESV